MAKKRLSVELDDAALQALDEHAREEGESRQDAAARLLEEGLRMAKHPGVVFRPGPVGRRAALSDGPDIWQVAYIFRDEPLDSDAAVLDAISDTCSVMALSYGQAQAAVRYYIEYRSEIDEWMRNNDEEADRGYAEWLRKQELIRS